MPVGVVGALVAASLAFLAARQITSATVGETVRLMAIEETGEYPFTGSVSLVSATEVEGIREAVAASEGPGIVGASTGQGDTTEDGASPGVGASVPTSGTAASAQAMEAVSVEDTVLYGSRSEVVCDRPGLIELLRADDDVIETWADLSGVEVDDVPSYVDSLTPLLLGRDTAVTNSQYRGGQGERFQSVLQAGTAVLVDDRGMPRVQCSCGNPLAVAEVESADIEFEGAPWEGFEPEDVVAVQEAGRGASVLRTIDVDTHEASQVVMGGIQSLDGFLVDDDTGVHVVGTDGSKTTVLNRPVDAVFDDGAGGIIYQLPPGDGSHTTRPPASDDQAVIWHLPARSTEPEVLIEAETDGGWVSLSHVGLVHGQVAVAYLDMRSPDGGRLVTGSLRLLRVVDRSVMTVIDDAWHQNYRLVDGGYSVTDVRLGDSTLTWQSGTYGHMFLGCSPLPQWVDDGGSTSVEETSSCYYEVWAEHDISTDGRVVALDTMGEQASLRIIDLPTGDLIDSVDLGRNFGSAPGRQVDLHADGSSALVSFPNEGLPALLVDLRSPSYETLDIQGRVAFLTAPLERPDSSTDQVEPIPGSSEDGRDDPTRGQGSIESLDMMSARLPAGTCNTPDGESWRSNNPIQLVDGSGNSDPFDPVSGDFSGVAVIRTSVVGYADLDHDGSMDALLAVDCAGSPVEMCCAGRASLLTVAVSVRLNGSDLELIGTPVWGDPISGALSQITDVALDGTRIRTTESVIYPETDGYFADETRAYSFDGQTWVR